MKVIFTVFTLFIIHSLSIGQNNFRSKIEWSERLKIKKNYKAPKQVIGYLNSNVIIRGGKGFVGKNRLKFYQFSEENMSYTSKDMIRPDLRGGSLLFIDHFWLNGKLIFQYCQYKKGFMSYYLCPINSSDMSIEKYVEVSKWPIESPPHKLLLRRFQNRVFMQYRTKPLCISPDQSLIVTASQISKEGRIAPFSFENKTFKISQFDNELNHLSDFEISTEHWHFNMLDGYLNNNGVLFLCGHPADSTGNGYTKNSTLHVIAIDLEKKSIIKDLEIGHFGLQKDDFKLVLDSSGGFFIAGINARGVSYVFGQKYDSNLELVNEELPMKDVPDFGKYKVHHLYHQADSSFILIAEQEATSYYNITITEHKELGKKSENTYTYPVSHKDNIMILKFDRSGKLDWSHFVNKKQKSLDWDYTSYFAFKTDSSINIMYNQIFAKAGKYQGVNISINQRGERSQELIVYNPSTNQRLVPRACYQINDSKAFIYTIGVEGEELGILNINNGN